MTKFHINPATGDPGKCGAEKGNCPFGGPSEHFTSPEAARAAYEKSQAESSSEFQAIKKDLEDFGRNANSFKAWGEIHSDFKTNSDGVRRVLVGGPRGTVLTPWRGPKALERYEENLEIERKAELLDALQEIANNPPSSFAGYTPTVNPMKLEKIRMGDRYYDQFGTAYIVESYVRNPAEVTMNPLDDKGQPLGQAGKGVIVVSEGRNKPEKFFKLSKLNLGGYVDSEVGGTTESQAVKALPESGTYERSVSGVVQYYDENNKVQTMELVSPVGRLTDGKRIELGRQLWAFTGNDPKRYEDASDEEKLRWANQRIMRRKNFQWKSKDGYVSYNHDQGGGSRSAKEMLLVEL